MVLGAHRLPAAKVTVSFGRKDQDVLSCQSLINPAPRSDESAVTELPAACREHGDFKASAPCEAPPARRPPTACRAGGSVCGGPATKRALISRAGTVPAEQSLPQRQRLALEWLCGGISALGRSIVSKCP